MRSEPIVELRDCTEFRQTLLAAPSRVAHASSLVLFSLLAAALIWGWLAQANLIVRAPGRVRPVSTPSQIFATGGGEVLGSAFASRITKVHVHEGDVVKQGDPLVEIDTERLDAEIARQQELIQTAAEEVKRITRLIELLDAQSASATAKQQAELSRARAELEIAEGKRASEIRLAESELEHAQEEFKIAQEVSTKIEQLKASLAVAQVTEKLSQANLPIDAGQVAVLERALELIASDHAVKRQELSINLAAKQGELAAAEKQLAKHELERKQSVLYAPFDGVITRGQYVPGDVLKRGEPSFEMAQQSGFLFEAAVASEDIGLVRVGMPVQLKLDAYDFQKYGTLAGTVQYVSPDSARDEEAERPVTAFVIRVSLSAHEFGHNEDRAEVKLGMGGVAEVVTDKESLLYLFFKKVRQSISLE